MTTPHAPRRSAAHRSKARRPSAARAARPRILLLEGEPRPLAPLRALLGKGYALQRAADPAAALEKLAARPADLIVAADRLPGMQGAALLARAARLAPAARRLLLAGPDRVEPALAAVRAGRAHLVLTRPVADAVLAPAILRLCAEGRLEQERDALRAGNASIQARLEKLEGRLESQVRGRTLHLSKANARLEKELRAMREQNMALNLLTRSLNIQATVDALTGLYNRREFNTRLHEEWGRFKRHKRPLGLIMFDIDYFKRVNDEHGHECGDRVLQALGELVRQHQRRQDIYCRFGGEEFVALLPETGVDAVFTVAETLRRRVAAHPFRCGRKRLRVHISLGVASAEEHNPANEDDFVKVADIGLYQAKGSGRNRTVVVRPDDREAVLRVGR